MKHCLLIVAAIMLAGCMGYSSPSYDPYYESSPEAVPRDIYVTAFQFGFDPPNITIYSEEQVRIILRSLDAPHSFRIPELGINQYIPTERLVAVSIQVNQSGNYTYYSDAGVDFSSGMKGVLTVLEPDT